MKKGAFIVTAALLYVFASSLAEAGEQWHFNFGVFPLGVIIAPNIDGFSASRGYYTETITGTAGYAPGIFAGVDYDTNKSGIGIDVFGSEILSDVLTGSIFGTNVSYILPHAEDGIFRGRIKGGVMHGTLEWEGDTRVNFDDATGWQAGIGFDVGRNIGFYGELLYRRLEFNVNRPISDSTNKDTLNLSGGVVNLGVKFMF